MAAPAFRAEAHAQVTTAAASVTVTKPTGTASGDLLLAFAFYSRLGTPPTGWTRLFQISSDTGWVDCLYKIAGGSEPASYTFNWEGGSGVGGCSVATYSGVDGTNPIDVYGTDQTQTGATITSPSVSTIGADRTIVAVYERDSTGTVVDTWGTPTGYTLRLNFQETGFYNFLGIFDKAKAVAGVESGAASTTTSGNSTNNGRIGVTAAIALAAPAASGAPGNTDPPQLTGTAQSGATLKVAQTGMWTNSPTSFTYQWQRSSTGGTSYVSITNATASTYVLTDQDVGTLVRCVVTAVNGSGSTAAATQPTYEAVRVSTTPKISAGQLGVALGGNFYSRSQAQQQAEITDARSVGAYYFRFEARWSDIETAKGTFSWTLWDRIVTDITSRGGVWAPAILFAPAWAGAGGTAPPTNDSDLADFVTAFVNRYKPGGTYGLTSTTGIQTLEVWNEPNISSFWGGATPSPTKYASMLAAAYTAAHAAYAGITLMPGGLAPFGSYGSSNATGMNPKNFLEALYTAWGGVSKFDALAVHTYPSTDVQDYRPSIYSGWSDLEDNTPSYRSILTAHGDQGKPIWVTEQGFPIGQVRDDAHVMTAQEVADRVTEGYSRWARFSWPKGAITWFSHRPESSATGAYQYGLLTEVATPTPRRGWYAYRDMAVATAAAPANAGGAALPQISGSATVGSTLSASTGTWTNSPTAYAYQWNRGGSPIAGATNSTYLVDAADSGTTITVTVTASNSAGSASATSAGVAVPAATPVNTVAPVVSGTPAVGQTLSSSTGTWTGAPTSFAYQWRWNPANVAGSAGGWTNIAGATGPTYVVAVGDAGRYLDCDVTATA